MTTEAKRRKKIRTGGTPTAAELHDWRMTQEFTQDEAAEIAGVHRVAWARWETGARAVPHWLGDILKYRVGVGPC